MRTIRLACVVTLASFFLGAAGAADVTGTRIVGADKEPQNWLSNGRTYSEQRFSPLKKINTTNIDDLGLAWSADIKGRTARGLEATPLVVDGIMYTSGAWSHVFAFDAKTGRELWEFDPKVPGAHAARGCCDVANRGVAVWGGKVFVGTYDGRLIALDARKGHKVWETLTVDPAHDYTITGAPRIVKGRVIIGNGGAEFGVRGYVTAYDAETGKQAWRFYTVPGNPKDGFESRTVEMIARTWSGEWWKQGGGGTVWDSMAYDPELDLLYVGVGNGSSWSWKLRSENTGDNLFLASIVAIRPETGEYVWHYQTTPGDDWDYTATQHMILADLMIDGAQRQVIMQAPKNGFFYVLDRRTGAFITGTPYVAMSWATGIDEKGRPIINPDARYGITGKPALVTPGPLGGHNWQPMSYSPLTGLVYIPAIETAFPYQAVDPKSYTRRPGGFWNTGLDPIVASIPHDEAVRKAVRAASKGRLIAWDPVGRTPEWTIEYPVPWNGGLLSTAGGVLFQGTGHGKFIAYEARSGRKLWDFDAQTGIIAAPMTYEVDGEQFVTILAGWGGAAPNAAGEIVTAAAKGNTNRVLTFRLGGKASLPGARNTLPRPLDPPADKPTREVFERGLYLYQVNCMICHGDTAVSGGVVPDLRFSPALGSLDAWKSIVADGRLVNNGMVPFAGILKGEEIETIRAYVIQRAHDEKARLAAQ